MIMALGLIQDFIESFAIGVGNKYLSETLARNQFYNLFHTNGVEPVENIVEQQDGCFVSGL